MQPRSWLTVLKLVFITVAALVLADLVSLSIRARNTPAPSTAPIAPAAAPSAAPAVASEQQAIEQTKGTLGDHPDVTKETPRPAPSAAASGAPAPAAVPAASIPDPSLQMVLVGTIVSPGASIAIVLQGGKENVLQEGTEIGQPAFKVAEIRENSVVMEMSGVKKTLWMPSFQPPAQAPAAQPQAPPPPGILPPPPAPTVASPPAEPGKSIISRSERDKVMGNLQDTLQDLRIIPNKKNGADYGSKVVFLKPGSFLSKVGLQQDDILLSVNGSPVSNAEQGLNVFQAFQHEDKIVMKIDRGGKAVQQEVEFR